MSTSASPHIIPLLPLQPADDVHGLVDALRRGLPTISPGTEPPFCIWLQFPARVFPSSWGSISGNYAPISAPKLDVISDGIVLTPQEMEDLKKWHTAGLIRFMPVGFAGALLSVLTPEEIRSELDWSLSNTWRSGIKDNFGQASKTIIPFWPDSRRAMILHDSASRFDFCALGIVSDPTTLEWLVFAGTGPEPHISVLPWLSPESGLSAHSLQHKIENRLSASQSQGDLVVRLDMGTDFSGLGATISALENCGRRGHIGTSLIDPIPLSQTDAKELLETITQGNISGFFPLSQFMSPDFRGQLARLPEGRKARSATQERLKTQLTSAVPWKSPTPLEVKAIPGVKQRSLLAAMQGSVSILSDDFEARFHEGRFSGFYPLNSSTTKDDGIRFVSAPGLGLKIQGDVLHSETESAVSIESDHTHGLRETMVLKASQFKIPARMYVDFLMVDRSPHLLLDVQIRYPWIDPDSVVDELRPLQLSIVLGSDTVAVDVLCRRHDGTWNTSKLSLSHPLPPSEDGRWQLPEVMQGIAGKVSSLLKLPYAPKESDSPNESWHEDSASQLFGSTWVFSWLEKGSVRGLEVSRLPSEAGQSIPLEARVRRNKKHRCIVLDIFPEGRFFGMKGEDLGTLSQHFTLAVYPFFNSRSERPAMDSTIDRDIAPYHLVRTVPVSATTVTQ